ncbi:hypothetical protein DFP72DRAFT_905203 [Ephemerocybe angulata]|uniref:Uncharacterized protein n=1 Tax=Ephemerocybe angulata TaxID=980116 RepID=A0A8H6M5J5_9AGAR|nr:hypothetical protein DFP72DRAFT_905203 [Tulosesus angulatus]
MILVGANKNQTPPRREEAVQEPLLPTRTPTQPSNEVHDLSLDECSTPFPFRRPSRRLSKRARRRCHLVAFIASLGFFVCFVIPALRTEVARYKDNRHIPIPEEIVLTRCANIMSGYGRCFGQFDVDMDSAYFLARGALASGTVVVTQSDASRHLSSKMAKVTVHAVAEDPRFFNYLQVCEFKERASARAGVGIFTVPWRPRLDGHFRISIELPASMEAPLSAGEVAFDMPNFSHTFGPLWDVHFDQLNLFTSEQPIAADLLSARRASLRTSNAPIKGLFLTSGDINLQTANSFIDVNLDIYDPQLPQGASGRPGVEATLKTTNGYIQAFTNLTSRDGLHGCFSIEASTSRRKVFLDVTGAPSNATLHVDASTSCNMVDVKTHKNFEGGFKLEALSPFREVHDTSRRDEKTGQGRLRQIWEYYRGTFLHEGAVSWGKSNQLGGHVHLRAPMGGTKLTL